MRYNAVLLISRMHCTCIPLQAKLDAVSIVTFVSGALIRHMKTGSFFSGSAS